MEKNFIILNFLIRRWIRTIPPYFIAIICSTILLGYGDLKNLTKHLFYLQILSVILRVTIFFCRLEFVCRRMVLHFFNISYAYVQNKIIKENLIKNTLILLLMYFFLRLIFEFEHGWGENVRRSVLFRLDSIAYETVAYLIRIKLVKNLFFYFFLLV